MKQFFDLLPVILFFIAYKTGNPFAEAVPVDGDVSQTSENMFFATQVIMIAMTLQIIAVYALKRTVERMYVFTWLMVMILGGLTLALHNPIFIKWKPSIVNWVLGLAFLLSPYFSDKNLVQHMLGEHFEMPESLWKKTNLAWVAFFVVSGILNIIVAYNWSEGAWVNFKLFGLTGLSLVFMLGLVFSLQGYIKPLPDDEDDKDGKGDEETEKTPTGEAASVASDIAD